VNIPVIRQLLLIPALFWQRFNQMFFGIFISPDAEIGPGMIIHTPYGIFIPPVKIGSNCTFSSGVLIGSGCRSVGDNVYFGAGCKIVGDAKIGNNVVIVANSVVLTDVPDNITIMGVPARIKLPGGRPKKFAWRAIKPGENAGDQANGQSNGSKNSQHENKSEASDQQTPGPRARA
jgi:serine acetyltransferase